MEIEKKRETSWKIQLKEDNNIIQLTSVEISGEVRSIKLSVIKEEKNAEVEMNNEEFFNFLSLISAFKDVVIGETEFLINNQLNIELREEESEEELSYVESKQSEKNFKDTQHDELDPKDWDPW
jgi:hypothetical protein